MRKISISLLTFCLSLPTQTSFCIVNSGTSSLTRKSVTTAASSNVCIMSGIDVYNNLTSHLREISTLEGIGGLLGWDEMVMQPDGASQAKANQKEVLAGVLYDKKTDSKLREMLFRLQSPDFVATPVQAAVIREAAKNFKKNTALPKELVKKMTSLETKGYNAWIESRKNKDYQCFAPVLEEWLDASRAKANYIDSTKNPYDVLLQEYEKGMTTERVDELFSEVREGIKSLIRDIRTKGTKPDDSFLKDKFDVTVQAELCKSVAIDLGFDINKGRLDVSVHPFTGGSHPSDVRMTTRFKENDITEGITAAIHETGHSIYEQGRNLDEDYYGLPINEALSMGIHESQSLLWERMVGLSEPFQHYLLPEIQKRFPDSAFKSKTPQDLYKAINTIRDPSMIRVEADEVTYTMHVILRYEIEKGLINGDVKVADVPKIWNEKMQEYLGVTPSNDAEGCCQDIHWSGGAFGYFPTYSLGAMYACQIYYAALKAIPDLDSLIKARDFTPLRKWLNDKVHRSGSFHPNGDELMIAVTGKPLDTKIYLDYLRKKYTKIYQL